MTAATATATLDARLAAVPRPVPLLDRDEAAALTDRQREILDDLVRLIANGFSDLTMADIAASVGCSLRTLYSIAPSRDLLVLVACDRSLWGAGRAARRLVGDLDELDPVEAVRRYLRAATRAVSATTAAFISDLQLIPGGRELNQAHSAYLVAITRELLDVAVERGHIQACDTLVVAHAMAGVSNVFIQPDVITTLSGSPKEAADDIAEIMIRGLTTSHSTRTERR